MTDDTCDALVFLGGMAAYVLIAVVALCLWLVVA